jgi:hypothetical protein
MSPGKKTTAVPARSTRSKTLRHFGVEFLEPRTVLSSTQIVAIVIDAGFGGGVAPPPPEHASMVHESAPFDYGYGAPPAETWYLLSPWVAPAPLLMFQTLTGAGSGDRLADPAGKVVAERVVPPQSSTMFGDPKGPEPPPEGESIPPEHLTNGTQSRFGADLVRPAVKATQSPPVNQSSNATAANTVRDRTPLFALGSLVSPAVGSYWLEDVTSSDKPSSLNLLYSLRNAEDMADVSAASLLTGDVAHPTLTGLDVDAESWDLSGELDAVVSNDESPFDGDAAGLLFGMGEGGLVDVGVFAEKIVASEARHADKTPVRRAGADEKERVVRDDSSREAVVRAPEQSQVMGTPTPAMQTVRADGQRTLAAEAATPARVDSEGGMIETPAHGGGDDEAAPEADAANAVEAVFAQWPSSLQRTEIRMDAEVGVYQAFDLSTSPHEPDAPAGITVADSHDAR